MDIKEKSFFSIICALFTASLAGIVVILLSNQVRFVAMLVTVASFICAIAFLLIKFLLKDASGKIRAAFIAALSVISAITIIFSVIIGIAPILIFPANHSSDDYDALVHLASEENSRIEAVSAGGYNGWRLKASNIDEGEARPVVLFFMGNGMNSSRTALMFFHDKEGRYKGFSEVSDIVFIDYPGYGINDGNPTGDSIREMALASYDEVASWPTTSEVISFGYSIGTGPATYLASEREVAGLILWAPYANAYDLYNNYLDIFHGPFKLMVRYKMDSYKYIRDVNCPIIIFASDTDEVIPYQSSRDLFANAGSSSASFVAVPGISHNDFFLTDKVLDNTCGFIREVA